MLKSLKIYTHKGFKDVYLFVNNVSIMSSGVAVCRVSWYTKAGRFLTVDEIVIKPKDFINWRLV